MADSVKYMPIQEFLSLGFLQEANRQFFHPCGLALECRQDGDTGEWKLAGVWDYRDDPEGVAFATLDDEDSRAKLGNVLAEMERHAKTRRELFGSVVQPIPPAG